MLQRFLVLAFLALSVSAQADSGLVIHASEFIVGKFHRLDNQLHPYADQHAWKNMILPANSDASQALTVANADGSYSVFFSTLEEMVQAVTKISEAQKRPVSVLNIHGHGLPGGMWFPRDEAARTSRQCIYWRQMAAASDRDSYEQYYTPVTSDQINDIRQMAGDTTANFPCLTQLADWQTVLARVPGFKSALASDVQIHLLSCVVGLGARGQAFVQGLSTLILPQGGRLEASMNFGLGDWSMDKGMGFWDYQSDAQVDRDQQLNASERRDAVIAQKGAIRMATFASGDWGSAIISGLDFMSVTHDQLVAIPITSFGFEIPMEPLSKAPQAVRLPGTNLVLETEP